MTVESEGRCCPLLASKVCNVFVDDTVHEKQSNLKRHVSNQYSYQFHKS